MPTDILVYIYLVVCAAWGRSASLARNIIFYVIVIVGTAGLLVPIFGMTFDVAGLLASICNPKPYAILLGAVILARIICAPYWIWCEERVARTKAESQVKKMFARYAQLSVSVPYSVPDSSSGAVSWRIQVHNEGASATNVQMNLCDIPQRPKSQVWSHDFPYRIIQVGRTLDSNECHIHRGGDAIFELTKVWSAAHNSGFITTLDTRRGSHQVKIEPGERLEMRYAVTAENTDGLEFILIMHANSGGIALVRHVASMNESLQ